jgi:predicted nuclease of restriction endonuclease-like RecB superfamily
MLTGDLVRVSLDKNGLVKPGFVDPANGRMRARADEILAVLREGVGRRRWELDEEIAAIVGDGVDHKLTRGLVKLALDRCDFEVRSPLPPAELRARVFRMATEAGPLATHAIEGGRPTREQLLQRLAEEFGVSADDLSGSLYADHAERQVLASLEEVDGAWLLQRYNVALVQAVLYKAVELKILLEHPHPARVRQILRAVKFHQLIHAVQRTPVGLVVTLDGPASLFSQTTRYGLALARFFPALLLVETPWRLEARVEWTRGQRTLALDSACGLRSHYRDAGAWVPREVQTLVERWPTLDTGWDLVEDAAPLAQGPDRVVVPDLGFRKEGRIAWLEVLGYWRKAGLAARLAAQAEHGPDNLFLAVSRKLAGDPATLPDTVIPFSEVVPTRELLRRLETQARPEATR